MSQKPYTEIVQEMDSLIPREVISKRDGGAGRKLDYLEGWYVIDRLNKVVGQGYWAYSSTASLIKDSVLKDSAGKDIYSVHYLAQVRLVVTVGGVTTEFTDYGYGDGSDKRSPGKAHELAVKEAVTDGLKRAARCLGNSFGNGLYDKSGEGIDEGGSESKPQPPVEKAPSAVLQGGSNQDRTLLNKLIAQTSKVVIDKKSATIGDLINKVKSYGVDKKEDLSDAQATELLAWLRDLIK